MKVRPLLNWAGRTPRRRAATALVSLAVLTAIGALDWATGSALSFAAFYVLVVVVVTVAAGAVAGVVAAGWSAALWGVADVITGRSEAAVGVHVWNGITRFAVHGTVALLVTALLRALRAARESEARSRSFLAAAAHQLRTPIAALGTSIEALLLEGANPGQERLLANVAGETSRLGRLVASLLRTARLDQGEPLRRRPVDLLQLCEDELDRVRHLSDLEWRLAVLPGTPRLVRLDPGATTESLGNLLDNARRHATKEVEVRLWRERNQVVLEVADDGPGLPSGAENRAFERFVTLDGQGGTGLGLGIARDLARRQGGDLVYAHKAFVLTLPSDDMAGAEDG